MIRTTGDPMEELLISLLKVCRRLFGQCYLRSGKGAGNPDDVESDIVCFGDDIEDQMSDEWYQRSMVKSIEHRREGQEIPR